jgi:putative nucleotidyltransferase with HDIG domain
MLIGKRLELSVQELKILRTGAVLHDIGKIGLFHTLLNKTGSLSSLEADLIKQHPLVGHNIISPVALDKEICNIILQHHERVDGTGYPHGLVDHEISFLAKIVAIADSYDAMTSGRAYRENLSHVQAYQEIKRCAGSRYDLICTDCFINLAEILDFTTLDFMSADQFLSIDM